MGARPWVLVLAAVLTVGVGVLLFGYMFGFDLPFSSAAFWSRPKHDMAAMTAGYEALMRGPWSGSGPAITERLSNQPLSIVFTDSIPWLSLALKAANLGFLFNPLGLFLLIAYALQGLSMVWLLRAMGVRRLAPLVGGGLLALMTPAWIARQFGHIALTGHFLLILTLALTVAAVRGGLTRARAAGFCALGALAVGIHAYHLVPFALCLGAALVATLLQRGPRAAAAVLATGTACVAAVAASALFLGYDIGRGVSSGAGALGVNGMNLLGPIFPQASGLFGQDWNGIWFSGTYETTIGQPFEGFNYVGAGALATVAAALILLIGDWRRGRRPDRAQWLRFAPLALAAIALAVLAVGPTIYVYTMLLAELPKPTGRLGEMAGYFRSHGRFFWAPTYLMLAGSICLLSRRLRPGVLAVLLTCVLTLQAFDTAPLRTGVRDTFAAPAATVWPEALTRDPALRARHWVFNPTYFCLTDNGDMTALSQLVLIAIRQNGTVNSVATARASDQECGYPTELLTDAAPDDRRITVVFNQGREDGGRLAAYSRRNDCRRFARGVICGRDLEGVGLTPVAGAALLGHRPVAEVRFDTPDRHPLLLRGWSKLDPGGQGVWSDGRTAIVQLPTPATWDAGDVVNIDLTLFGYSDTLTDPQRIAVRVGAQVVGRLDVKPGVFEPYRVRVPVRLLSPGRPLLLTLDMPGVHALSQDPRALGVAIRSATISY